MEQFNNRTEEFENIYKNADKTGELNRTGDCSQWTLNMLKTAYLIYKFEIDEHKENGEVQNVCGLPLVVYEDVNVLVVPRCDKVLIKGLHLNGQLDIVDEEELKTFCIKKLEEINNKNSIDFVTVNLYTSDILAAEDDGIIDSTINELGKIYYSFSIERNVDLETIDYE